jgi:hypothetical protein
MVPNAKVLMVAGSAFVAGVSTMPLIGASRSPDPARPATASASAGEPGPAARAWEDPTSAKPFAAAPSLAVPRDERRRAAAADAGRPASSPARPPVASAEDGLPDIVPIPSRRRTLADTAPVDGFAAKRPRLASDAPVARPVQRLAGDVQGPGTTRPVRGGDGLLRWLSE